MRPHRVVLAVVLACLVCAPAAAAAEFSFGGGIVQALEVSNGAAAWVEAWGDPRARSAALRVGHRDSDRAMTVYSIPEGTYGGGGELSVAGNRALLRWTDRRTEPHAALLGGPEPEFRTDLCNPWAPAALSGTLLIHPGADCGGSTRVLDLRTGVDHDDRAIGPYFRTAGHLVAWREPQPDLGWAPINFIVVYDPVARRVVRRVPLAGDSGVGWAFGEDGTVATAGNEIVVWPPGRGPVKLGSDIALNSVTVAGGVVIYSRRVRYHVDQYIAKDLNGKTIQGFWAAERSYPGMLAFDGRTVAAAMPNGRLRVSRFPVPGERELPTRGPRFKRLRVSPRRFGIVGYDRPRRGRHGAVGARIEYRLERKANVEMTVARLRRGRPARRIGTLQIAHRRARGSYRFTGYLQGRRLRRGRYRATLVAIEAGLAKPGPARSVTLTIAKPR